VDSDVYEHEASDAGGNAARLRVMHDVVVLSAAAMTSNR